MSKCLYFDLNGKRTLMYDSYYKCFTAAYAKSTGLPMFGGSKLSQTAYREYEDIWLSKSRCKKIKKPVTEGEKIVAWYRVKNGYAALYDRSK